MKLWPGAVTRYCTFILRFYPTVYIEGMGSLTLTGTGGPRCHSLESRNASHRPKKKGKPLVLKTARPEASAEISSVLGGKRCDGHFFFNPLLEHPGLGLKLRSSAPSSLARLGSPYRFWGLGCPPDRPAHPRIHAENSGLSAVRSVLEALTASLPPLSPLKGKKL